MNITIFIIVRVLKSNEKYENLTVQTVTARLQFKTLRKQFIRRRV